MDAEPVINAADAEPKPPNPNSEQTNSIKQGQSNGMID
jgi:hypothetical protein